MTQTTDDTQQLQAGTDQPALQSGADAALAALSSARSQGLSDDQNLGTTDDELVASDQIAQTITSLQNVIERNADQLDELKTKLKEFREQLRSVFENDTSLSEAEEQAIQYQQQIKDRKSRLMSDPQVTSLQVKIGELNEQKKEIEEALSDHLVNYYQLTNSKSFDTSDGDQREFVIKASVRGRRAA